MFNPVPRSKAEEKISLKAEKLRDWADIEKSPLRLDLLILSAYVDNWRPALADLADIFQEQVRRVFVALDVCSGSDFNAAQVHFGGEVRQCRRFPKHYQFHHHE